MTTRILLIGQGIFSDGLTRLIGEIHAVEIMGAVETLAQARVLIEEDPPDVLIVDHAQINQTHFELDTKGPASIKIIYLSLSENKMVVHNCQQLVDVTVPVLVQTLQTPQQGDASI